MNGFDEGRQQENRGSPDAEETGADLRSEITFLLLDDRIEEQGREGRREE